MRVLLKSVKEKGLFFFDSYTSTSTKSAGVARELGLPFEENSFFVDLKDEPAFMDAQFQKALKKAKKYGSCAVIGHIHKKSLEGSLRTAMKLYRDNGAQFVYLNDLMADAGQKQRK